MSKNAVVNNLSIKARFNLANRFLKIGCYYPSKSLEKRQRQIRQIVQPITKTAPRIVKKIQSDKLNFDKPSALENEVIAIMYTTLRRRFNDSNYPTLSPKADLSRFGITSHNRIIALMQVLFTCFKDVFKAAKNKDTSVIVNKWAWITASHIARKYGYNKGRQRNQYKRNKEDTNQGDFGNREVRLDGQREIDVASTSDMDSIENQELYQQIKGIYQRLDPRDQLVLLTNKLSVDEGLSWEAAWRRLEDKYRGVAITTCRGAKKRKDSLFFRYPELKEIKELMSYK